MGCWNIHARTQIHNTYAHPDDNSCSENFVSTKMFCRCITARKRASHIPDVTDLWGRDAKHKEQANKLIKMYVSTEKILFCCLNYLDYHHSVVWNKCSELKFSEQGECLPWQVLTSVVLVSENVCQSQALLSFLLWNNYNECTIHILALLL